MDNSTSGGSSGNNTTNSTDDSGSDSGSTDSNSTDSGSSTSNSTEVTITVDGKKIVVKKVDKDAKSKAVVSVRDVTTQGELIVRFSEPIFVPSNFTEFSSKELLITYTNELDPNVTLENWKISSFDEQYMFV